MALTLPTPAMRTALDDARARARELLPSGGTAACHAICDALDGIVRTLYDTLAAGAPPLALLATGGWGRRDTCPYSDAGIEVGHSVRSVAEAVALAGDDLATVTALLDARPLAGDAALAAELA